MFENEPCKTGSEWPRERWEDPATVGREMKRGTARAEMGRYTTHEVALAWKMGNRDGKLADATRGS